MTSAAQQQHEIAVLRNQNQWTLRSVRTNVDGVTHAHSLIHPEPAGSCMNWVIGHLLCVYNNVLPVLGQERVMDPETLNRYNRGAAPIHNETALPFDDLMSALNDAVARFDAGLAASTDEVLDGKAPFSPTNDPTETVRSVMGFVMFHQAYHAGQTGVLRRVIGKPGAI